MKDLDIKVKIVVGVKEDGSDDVQEVDINKAVAFLKNQLDALERLQRAKKEWDDKKWQEEMQKAMEKAQKEVPSPPPYIPGQPTWIDNSDLTAWPGVKYTNTIPFLGDIDVTFPNLSGTYYVNGTTLSCSNVYDGTQTVSFDASYLVN
jgi:hypothetical protein